MVQLMKTAVDVDFIKTAMAMAMAIRFNPYRPVLCWGSAMLRTVMIAMLRLPYATEVCNGVDDIVIKRR